MKNYEKLKKRLLSDEDVDRAYQELSPEFVLIEKMIKKRITKGLTQAELAQILGTKQSAISRFESGSYNPTIKFLSKTAQALGTKLTISLR